MGMKDIKPLMDALKAYRLVYDNEGADYSATDLIQPPRITILGKRHRGEILKRPIDPKSELDSFWGTGIHHMFEANLRYNPEYICERRLHTEILDRKISGCPDIIRKSLLWMYDIKQTKAWKKIFSDLHEWEEQLNIYAYMYWLKKIHIKALFVIAWWKNWEEKNVRDNPKYPREQIEEIPLRLWTPKEQEDYLYSRVLTMINAEPFPDDQLPLCTPDDRWDRATQYAVYKIGKNGKRFSKASRVMYAKDDIERWIKKMLKPEEKYEIDMRPGGRERCDNWCEVNTFCSQYRDYLKEKENEESNPDSDK